MAALQDLLNYVVKGLSQVAVEGRKVGVNDQQVNQFTSKAIFSTLTNVDFDPARFVDLINEAVEKRDALKQKVNAAGGNTDFGDGPSTFVPESTTAGLVAQGENVGIQSDPDVNEDILSLRELLIYGIRGLAAYADHAAILGQEDDGVYAFTQEGMAATLDNDLSVDDYVGLVLKCGEHYPLNQAFFMTVIKGSRFKELRIFQTSALLYEKNYIIRLINNTQSPVNPLLIL